MTVCIGGSPSGKCIEPFLRCSRLSRNAAQNRCISRRTTPRSKTSS